MDRNFYQIMTQRVSHIVFLIVNLLFAFGYCMMMLEYAGTQSLQSHVKINWIIAIGYISALYLLARVYNGFLVGSARISEIFFSMELAVGIADAGTYVLLTIYMTKFLNPLYLVALLMVQTMWNLAWAYASNRTYFRTHGVKPALVISNDAGTVDKLRRITYFDSRFHIVGHLVLPVDTEEIESYLDRCEVLFLVGLDIELRNTIMKKCIGRVSVFM